MSWKDEARRRMKEVKAGNNYKLAEGDNTFRLLPNKEGLTIRPYIEGRMHYKVGRERRSMSCGKDIDGVGNCWLCDVAIPQLQKSKQEGRLVMAENIAASDYFLVQVSPVNESGEFGKAKPLWVSSKVVMVALLQLITDAKRSYEDPVKGRNITINRIGTGMSTKYGAAIPDDEPSRVPKSVLATIQEFDKIARPYSAKEQKAAFYGRDVEPDEEDEPDIGEEEEPEEDLESDEGTDEPEDDEGEAEDEDEPGTEEDEDESNDSNDLEDEEEPEEDEDFEIETPRRKAAKKKAAPVASKKKPPPEKKEVHKKATKKKARRRAEIDDDDVPF